MIVVILRYLWQLLTIDIAWILTMVGNHTRLIGVGPIVDRALWVVPYLRSLNDILPYTWQVLVLLWSGHWIPSSSFPTFKFLLLNWTFNGFVSGNRRLARHIIVCLLLLEVFIILTALKFCLLINRSRLLVMWAVWVHIDVLLVHIALFLQSSWFNSYRTVWFKQQLLMMSLYLEHLLTWRYIEASHSF